MQTHNMVLSSLLAVLLFFFSSSPATSNPEATDASNLQTYIVQVRPPPQKLANASAQYLEAWYKSFLPRTAADSTTLRMVYMYRDAITGFAARLTDDEVGEMGKDGLLKASPDRVLPLLTTHTPAFLGLTGDNGSWNGFGYGNGIIIGMLDSGLVPGHPSMADDGMPSPPAKWKGFCESNWSGCNKKVIGARSFLMGSPSSVNDSVGHGTHTASTAAGNFVKNANVLGSGNCTAVGMAPRAHLAIYKVCDLWDCKLSDVLAGMDAAIKDGVDVISLSLGRHAVPSFHDDVIAIGAFSAMEKGIFVSCAAGNSGPNQGSVDNEAPWVLTVAASTMDRNLRVTVKLGDGTEINGESAYQPHGFPSTPRPLVYPPSRSALFKHLNCYHGAFNNTDIHIKGKVVVCNNFGSRIEMGKSVKEAGGAAMVIVNGKIDGYTTFANADHLPASHVSYVDGVKIISYINKTKKPTASIVFKGTIIGISPAPTVASFSPRGPSRLAPGILKPDIIGPGVNILAAWPFQVGPPSKKHDESKMTFNIISGTSMSTPHLSGIVALVKRAHPKWSPAAIKSAIMTTSDVFCKDGEPINDEQHQPAGFFVMGAGHVNPSKAADPGLVYDLDARDYVSYLCGLGYTDQQVELVTRHNITCSKIKKITEAELNYPAILVPKGIKRLVVNRTVTNVGEERSTYTVKVEVPEGVKVSVVPKKLEFFTVKEKKSFTVIIDYSKGKYAEGNLVWVSDKHVVRSHIVMS